MRIQAQHHFQFVEVDTFGDASLLKSLNQHISFTSSIQLLMYHNQRMKIYMSSIYIYILYMYSYFIMIFNPIKHTSSHVSCTPGSSHGTSSMHLGIAKVAEPTEATLSPPRPFEFRSDPTCAAVQSALLADPLPHDYAFKS